MLTIFSLQYFFITGFFFITGIFNKKNRLKYIKCILATCLKNRTISLRENIKINIIRLFKNFHLSSQPDKLLYFDFIIFCQFSYTFLVYTMVDGDYINIMSTTFLFKLKLLTSFFRITSLQVNTEKLFKFTASLCFHVFVYPCCLKAWYK